MRRFILVGDIVDAWSAFGGHAAQLTHLSIARHIATAESVAISIMYVSDVRAQIRRLGRLMGGSGFVRFLTEGDAEIKQR